MKYTYAYKTSDGARHEEAMEAGSREAVFVALREKGIKAIKVVAADGSKANGEIRGIGKRILAASIVATALLAGLAVYSTLRVQDPARRPASSALIELRSKAAALAEKHKADIAGVSDKAKTGAAVLELREGAKELFKDILNSLPNEAEQLEAKRLYGELMILADHTELE